MNSIFNTIENLAGLRCDIQIPVAATIDFFFCNELRDVTRSEIEAMKSVIADA